MKIIKFTFIIITVILICNCSSHDSRFESFEMYLNSTFLQENIDNENIYFIIGASCFACSEQILNMLNNINNQKLVIISVGIITAENADSLKTIAKGKRILFDSSFNISKYPLGIEKGLVLHIKQHKILYYSSLSSYDSCTVNYCNSYNNK